MTRLVARRLLLAIPTAFGVTLVTFALMHLAPGDPAAIAADAGGGSAISREAVALFRETHGLDRPLPVQYGRWLASIATLDFGKSFRDGRPAMEKIREALPATIWLAGLALLLAYGLAIPLGVFTAAKDGRPAARAVSAGLFAFYALPHFVAAVTLLVLLGGGRFLDLFPIQGLHAEGAQALSGPAWLGDLLWHSVLPVFCLSYALAAGLARYLRASMLETLSQDFIRTARAKGLSERTVVWRHALRQAATPLVSLLGAVVPALLGGSVIVESVFGIHGLGSLSLEAILARDYNVIMALATVAALFTLVAGLAADLLQLALDPRLAAAEGAA